jgi:hypothetical protein
MQEIDIRGVTDDMTKRIKRVDEIIKIMRDALAISQEMEHTWNPIKLFNLWRQYRKLNDVINNFDFKG